MFVFNENILIFKLARLIFCFENIKIHFTISIFAINQFNLELAKRKLNVYAGILVNCEQTIKLNYILVIMN